MKKVKLEQILYALYFIVVLLATYVWGNQLKWSLSNMSSYTLFPLLGLLAFSLMWVHYVSGYLRDKYFPGQSTKTSFKITSYFVLVLIILHPALILTKLFADGYGFPPGSYKEYVGSANVIWVMVGTLGFAGLLSFEARLWFNKRSWWKYMSVVNDVAVLLIALHSLKLGHNLKTGWFVYVWYFYITTIVLCMIRTYHIKVKQKLKL